MSRKEKTIVISKFNEMKAAFNESIKVKLEEQFSDSAWYSLSDIKEYIDFIEQESDAKGIDLSGIRLHFLAETEGNQQLTLALVPTYKDGDKNIGFDPVLSSKNNPKKLSEIEEGSDAYTENGSIMDKAVLCPDICE